MSTATVEAPPEWKPVLESDPQNLNPPPPVVQPLAPVKPGDTLSGSTTIDQMIAALYQTNTLGTPTAYVWTDPTCITVTYSHQSVIYIRLTAKAAPGSGLKIGLT